MSYHFTPREISLHDEWDVIVMGGGPAGVAASVAAAREGKKTLLLEATGALGGMSTMGMVPTWCPFSDKEKIIYRGIGERILMEGKKFTPHVPKEKIDWVPIQYENLKVIYDDLMEEFGVKVIFNTVLSAVDASDGRVNALIVTNKAGLSAYSAKVYIDCTGDADLAYFAGAETVKGEESDATALQPSTHCFTLGNVDMEKYKKGPWLHTFNERSPIYPIIADPEFPHITDAHICIDVTLGPGTVGFNAGHINELDATDPEAVSAALMLGRKKAHEMLAGMKKYHPEGAFDKAYVQNTAPLMGIRESRRVVCDYKLTIDDYMKRRTFPDEIARNCYYIDLHRSEEQHAAAAASGDDVGDNLYQHYEKGESHGIPYGCLAVKGFTNMLVAGRTIWCDRRLQASVRVMPNCFTTGEAAGIAASLAIDGTNDIHTISTDALREKLLSHGAYFH
ncbi:MAG: FAD-dependent oxidoreductase [Clostridia bacterium]|nr:FAD-dependent oxidoreductase [Clostridia bacterium]